MSGRTEQTDSPKLRDAKHNDDNSPSLRVVELNDANPARQPKALPLVLSFNNLSYSVKVRWKMMWFSREDTVETAESIKNGSTKMLLNDISGKAREGEIMAVLGASGSGKSTLIDALANRIAKGSLNGSVTLNSEALESKLLKAISAYVMQDDILFPMLTVEETLMFSAEFRLPRTLSKSKKKARVQALIDQLGLQSVAKMMIGNEGCRGVSGGERRRVSIGIDIIHNPILLFLDEPTSGLDSRSAFVVVKVLQQIAQSGSIVIMSVHQPSCRILNLIDQLIFLSHGQTVYSGSPGSLPQFFAQFGHEIPESDNRSEFALDLIRELEEIPGEAERLVQFNKSWQSTNKNNKVIDIANVSKVLSLNDAISTNISKGKLMSGVTNGQENRTSSVSSFANPMLIEMVVLAKRSVLNDKRQPESVTIRFAAILITGLVLASIFWHTDDSPKGVKQRLGFYGVATSTILYTCTETLPAFLQERHIFMRETAYNAYRRSSYVLIHSLLSIPYSVFLSFTFTTITFWSVGLGGGLPGFFFFSYMIIACFWAGSSYVTFISGMVSDVLVGYTLAATTLANFFLFSGYFMTRDRIPAYWIWFHYISLVKYPYEGVQQSEFGDPTKCFVRGIQIFDNTPLVMVPTSLKVELLNSVSILNNTCMTTGLDILKQQGITGFSKWNYLWITIAFGFLFRFLFYLVLLVSCKNKRS